MSSAGRAVVGAVGMLTTAVMVTSTGVAVPGAAGVGDYSANRQWRPTVAAAAALPVSAPVRLARLRTRMARAASWSLALAERAAAADLRGYSLVVVDGETTPATRVRTLQASGSIVLAYLSIGTIEDGRWWSNAARGYRLDRWADWGEWYANVNDRGFRGLVAGRVLPRMMAAGYDGVFLDNVDMVESHPGQRSGMAALLSQVSRDVHNRGRLVLAQNGDTQLPWMLPWLDGWNREDVSFTFDFDTDRYRRTSAVERAQAARAIGRVRALRRTALTTDYLPDPAAPGAARPVAEAVRYSCGLGAKPYVGSIGLDRLPRRPLHC